MQVCRVLTNFVNTIRYSYFTRRPKNVCKLVPEITQATVMGQQCLHCPWQLWCARSLHVIFPARRSDLAHNVGITNIFLSPTSITVQIWTSAVRTKMIKSTQVRKDYSNWGKVYNIPRPESEHMSTEVAISAEPGKRRAWPMTPPDPT